MTTENTGDIDSTYDDDDDEFEIPSNPSLFMTAIFNNTNKGDHTLTIATLDENQEPSTHQFFFEHAEETLVFDDSEMMETVSIMVETLLDDPDARIGATLRSTYDTGMEVRCWNLGGNDIIAFGSQKAIEAYCVKADTGKIVSPEPNVAYCDAWPINCQ